MRCPGRAPPGRRSAGPVFYACTNCDGNVYPAFSPETRVTDVSHNGNCEMFGGGGA